MNKAILVSALALTAGCRTRESVQGTVVATEDGKPIPQATVYVHTSKGDPFDRNQFFWMLSVGPDGRFDSDQTSGRLEGMYAIAPGRYPGFPDPDGVIRLRKIPLDTLPIRRGSVSILASGELRGFNFEKGIEVAAAEADMVAAAKGTGDLPIQRLSSRAQGGFQWLSEDHDSWSKTKVAFVNLTEAPETGYEASITMNTRLSIWYVKCADGHHFAKVLERHGSFGPDGTRTLDFEYSYQPKRDSRMLASSFTLDEFLKNLGSGERTDLRTKQ